MSYSGHRSYQPSKLADVSKFGSSHPAPPPPSSSSSALLLTNCFFAKTGTLNSLSDDEHYHRDKVFNEREEFCQALNGLKDDFRNRGESSDRDSFAIVVGRLKEVNSLLRKSLTTHRTIYAKDILEMALLVKAKIKAYYSCDDDTKMRKEISEAILSAIDNLSIAFTESLLDHSVNDRCQDFPDNGKRFEEIMHLNEDDNKLANRRRPVSYGTADDSDVVLLHIDGAIDKVILHASSWLDSAKFFMNYIEKRTSLEIDFAKNLLRMSQSAAQIIINERAMPLQSVYLSGFSQDMDLADTIRNSCLSLQNDRFIQPLMARCNEHKRICKELRDLWTKEERAMREASDNVRKSKAAYNTRCRDLVKAKEATKEATQKAVVTEAAAAAATSTDLSRLERRRRTEEDAAWKMSDAQGIYVKYVDSANNAKAQMMETKKAILRDVRQLIDISDDVLRTVTSDYFTLMTSRAAPVPQKFEALRLSSERYEPGSMFGRFVERLSATSGGSTPDAGADPPFTFEPFAPDENRDLHTGYMSYMRRFQEFGRRIGPSSTDNEQTSGRHVPLSMKTLTSESYSVSRSLDSSPVRNRSPHRRLTNSSSFDTLTDLTDAKDYVRVSGGDDEDVKFIHGLALSKVGQLHDFRKLRAIARCRQCDSYIYFNGFECFLCGLSSHKQCLRVLRWECGHAKNRGSFHDHDRSSSSSVDHHHQKRLSSSSTTDEKCLPDRAPYIIKKCIEMIDAQGLDVKGIYRVCAVKSKVENLLLKLESDEDFIDLSSESPHTVAGLLRLYIRELSNPLLPLAACQELVHLVKNAGTVGKSELIEQIKVSVSRIPTSNFWTFSCLVHHLGRVCDSSELNQMSASNLAVVFAPTLLKASDGAPSKDFLVDNQYLCRTAELLITNAKDIFGPDPLMHAKPGLKSFPSGVSLDEKETGEDEKDEDAETDDGIDDALTKATIARTTWFVKDNKLQETADYVHVMNAVSSQRRASRPLLREPAAEERGEGTSDDAGASTVMTPTDERPGSSPSLMTQRLRTYSPQGHKPYTLRREAMADGGGVSGGSRRMIKPLGISSGSSKSTSDDEPFP